MSRILLSALVVLAACQKDQGDKSETTPADTENQEAAGAGKTAAPDLGPKKNNPIKLPAPDDVASPPADAKKTDSGLAYKVLESDSAEAGKGERPGASDKVKVHYTGWTTDGNMFDSSVTRNRPAEFRLDRVIPGWTEGLQLMSKGDKFRLWIPEKLAYQGKPGRPQGMLVFDVELLDFTAAPKPPENVAKPPKNAKKTPKGVFYKVLSSGSGEKPRPWDQVKVHYTGWTTDGSMFDSSVQRGSPATFSVSGVIEGWTDALLQMQVGDKWRIWIPEKLAYQGKPGRPQGMLVFDVELLEVQKMPEPPPVPKSVAKPPKDAKKTEKGVYYKILSEGKKGGETPSAQSRVTVHYTGWTTDGKMFDSSVTRGKPATFGLSGVIPGWTDGLQQLSVGDKARLWIPEELAYQGKAGAPQGMLVFDVELLEVK